MPPAAALHLVLLVLLAPWGGAFAQEKLPPIDAGLRARFGFLDPVIKKLNHGTNFIETVRWEKGGTPHLLVHNPHRARLENLRLEAGGLVGETVSTPGDLLGLATADIDGDHRLDTLMLTSRGRLVTVLGDKTRAVLAEIEVGRGARHGCLRVADIDGDGRPDAVVLTRDGLRTVTRLAGQPQLSPPAPLFDTRPIGFELFDFDGDGPADVIVCASDVPMQVQLKRGDGRGGFGPWILLDTQKLLHVFPGCGFDGAPTLAAIQVQPRRVLEFRLQQEHAADRPALLVSAHDTETNKPRAFAQGDVDNDGDQDLVVADPEGAKVTFYLETAGRFEVREAASLAGIHGLAIGDVDGDGRQDLLLASPDEAALSWVPASDALDRFPLPLASLPKIGDQPALPIAIGCASAPAGGAVEVIVLARNKDLAAAIYRVRWEAGKPASTTTLCSFAKLRRDPLRLVCADLDGRSGTDVAYVVPGDGLHVHFCGEDGTLGESTGADAEGGSGTGFTKQMDDGALSVIEADGSPALLVVLDRYARSFRFDASGSPHILAQDNGPEGNPTLAMGTDLADGSRLYLDRRSKQLFRCVAGAPTISLGLPDMTPSHLLAHGADAIVLGKTGVLRVPFDRSYALETVRRHEPPTVETAYFAGITADLDGDGKPELGLLDSHIHGMHILVPQDDALVRALSFPVFQSDEQEHVAEPRIMAAGDIDGDERQDLLFLAHDRVLIYLQER